METRSLYVCMSPEDLNLQKGILSQAQNLGQSTVLLEEGCFESTRDQENYSVTFLGHAGTKVFGEHLLTPEKFVQQIRRKGFLIEKNMVMNLIGCEMGLITDKPSYAARVADVIFNLRDLTPKKQENLKNFKIRAENNFVTYEKIHKMTVSLYLDGSINASCVPVAQKEKYTKAEEKYIEE